MKIDSENTFDFEAVQKLMETIDGMRGQVEQAKTELETIKTAKENIEQGKFVRFYIGEKNSDMFLCSNKLTAEVSKRVIEEVYYSYLGKVFDLEEEARKKTDELFDMITQGAETVDQEEGSVIIVHVND